MWFIFIAKLSTQWVQNKLVVILQTPFSNSFHSIKLLYFDQIPMQDLPKDEFENQVQMRWYMFIQWRGVKPTVV